MLKKKKKQELNPIEYANKQALGITIFICVVCSILGALFLLLIK